jgi:hypothetical protein
MEAKARKISTILFFLASGFWVLDLVVVGILNNHLERIGDWTPAPCSPGMLPIRSGCATHPWQATFTIVSEWLLLNVPYVVLVCGPLAKWLWARPDAQKRPGWGEGGSGEVVRSADIKLTIDVWPTASCMPGARWRWPDS